MAGHVGQQPLGHQQPLGGDAVQRAAVSARVLDESVCDRPWAILGLHFMQGLNAAASAWARVSKHRHFSRLGVRTGYTGRQYTPVGVTR
jgi:hypothetical protein